MLLPPWNTPWHFDIGLTKSYDKVQISFTKHFSSTSHFFSPLLLLLQIRHWHKASSFAQFHLGREWIEWIERIEWIECIDWIDWVEWLEWLEWLECKTPIKDDPEQRIRIQIHPLKVSTLSPRPNWNPLIWRAPPPADHTRVQGSCQNISFTTSCDIFSRYSMFTACVSIENVFLTSPFTTLSSAKRDDLKLCRTNTWNQFWERHWQTISLGIDDMTINRKQWHNLAPFALWHESNVRGGENAFPSVHLKRRGFWIKSCKKTVLQETGFGWKRTICVVTDWSNAAHLPSRPVVVNSAGHTNLPLRYFSKEYLLAMQFFYTNVNKMAQMQENSNRNVARRVDERSHQLAGLQSQLFGRIGREWKESSAKAYYHQLHLYNLSRFTHFL